MSPQPPKTWDELVAAAEKVKALGPDTYGFALQGKEIETDAYWYYALWTHGGELLENGKSGIAGEAGVKAANLYKSMLDAGLTEPDPTAYNRQDIERLFKTGKVAMILSGPWLRGQIKTEAPRPQLRHRLDPGRQCQGHLRRDRQHHDLQELDDEGRGLEVPVRGRLHRQVAP